jgi:exosortase
MVTSLNTLALKRFPVWRILLAVPLAILYAPVFADLARSWWNDQYAGHGMFVPAFSAFLAWSDRDRLRAAAGQPSRAGIPVILAALAILATGRWSGSLLLAAASVAVAVAGVVLWTLGRRCLRVAAFPVAFLVFMAPLPDAIVDSVTLHLQLFAARVAGTVLEMLDVPFFQSGVDIVLPLISLRVAEVCNGLRFLMALLVLTLAFAYVTQRSPARMAVLVASAIPIAILANAARVTAIAVAVQYVGPEAASGTLHNAIGKAMWALTLLPLAGIGLLLRGGRVGRGAWS